jgi:2-polyprenyl-3-methyl-5-hydroxy-6-metoxy-1,4-benzoquinol methylase
MSYFDEENASEEELWNWCRFEYNSSNAVVKKMIDNYYEKIKEIIVNYFKKDIKVLEVGCGAAESSDKILGLLNGRSFEISDYDIRFVNKIREHKKYLNVSQESVYDLKRADNSFDAIFFLEVLEHLENYELALKELFRVSSGYVIIAVPNEPLWRFLNLARLKYIRDWGNTPGHLNHWDKSKLMKLISKYGTVIKTYQPLPWIILLARKK